MQTKKKTGVKATSSIQDTTNGRPSGRVALCDLTTQYKQLKREIDAAIQAVAASGNYILGPNVKELEKDIAAYCGCKFAVGVANGTDALHLALRALRIGPGDEVITTPFTFIATTEAIGIVGATPVFADIIPRTFNLDPEMVERAITPRTKAILPVHLYGQPCDMDALMDIAKRHKLHIVEDCAQSLGAKYRGKSTGSFGAAGCLSFFPSKNLGCIGDGGMVVTNDREVYERVEMLRRHGGRVKYHHEELGINSRLDELQAAILRVKFKHLEQWNQSRRSNAYSYNKLFAETPSVVCPLELGQAEVSHALPDQADHPIHAIYHQYTLLVHDRDVLAQSLGNAGIGCAVYYPVPLHLQKANEHLGYREGQLPVAEETAQRCLSLPMYPELTLADQQRVVDEVTACVSKPGLRRAA